MKSSIELIRLIAVILITFTHTRNELEQGAFYFIIEKLPLYGTAILSIISGYLYYIISRKKDNLFKRKIKSLAIPYCIANVSVLLLVMGLYYFFDFDSLNRLSYDSSLITEGLFAFNSPPLNPPTYFVRDIFIIFSIISLFTQKEIKSLVVIIPFAIFGTLLLRLDVLFLFLTGVGYARFQYSIKKRTFVAIVSILTIIIAIFLPEYLKFPISLLIFILTEGLNFKFISTGRFSYLLHLYHSPIIVVTYPLISLFITNSILNIVCQILISLIVSYILFLCSKRYNFLEILSGGR